jgi:hypothetical protein
MTGRLAPALAAIAALAIVGVHPASALMNTTTPGVVYTIRIVLTDASISVGRDKFTRNGHPVYPRGAVIHYQISNNGKRPYAFRIWDRIVPPIRPGRHTSILINWNYRGTFSYFTLYHHKPAGPHGSVIIL